MCFDSGAARHKILTNQSTVEFSGAIFKRKGVPNPFDQGWLKSVQPRPLPSCAAPLAHFAGCVSFRLFRNWQSVFGEGDDIWWRWLMPTLASPPGTGIIYPVSRVGVSHIV
jgi:hypothetical protein